MSIIPVTSFRHLKLTRNGIVTAGNRDPEFSKRGVHGDLGTGTERGLYKLFHVGWTPGGTRPLLQRTIRVKASGYGQRRR